MMLTKKQLVDRCTVYGSGTIAYYDAHTVVVPCVVKDVIQPGNGFYVSSGSLKIVVTKDTGPYKRGEEMTVTGYHTFPRSHRISRGGRYTINQYYRWE